MPDITNPSNSNEEFAVRVYANGSDSIRIRGSLTTDGASSGAVAKRYIYLLLEGEDGDEVEEWIESAQTSGSKFYFPGPEAAPYAYVDGLSPDTTYEWTAIIAWGKDSNSLSSWAILTGEVTTEAEEPEVTADEWSWTASNGSATAEQTKNAYAILQGTRKADDFSHLVWNDLVDKIAEVRNARSDISVEWDNAYATKAKTKVAAGDTLSAVRFNSIAYNINNMKGVGVSYVSPEDVIHGADIISLVETLNAVIKNL